MTQTALGLSETPAPNELAEAGDCFHCGLPVPHDETIPSLKVLGKHRHFCCAGCYAVCEAITQSGLEDFYRYRTRDGVAGTAAVIPDILEKLSVYDRAEVQKGFVRNAANWSEAYLLLEEIRCPACLWLNERHLRKQPGVLDVSTDHATQRMRIRWDSAQTKLSLILKAVADIGYIAHPYDASHSEQLHEARKRRSLERIIYAGLLGMVVMNFSIATYIMGETDSTGGLPLWIVIGRWTGLFVCLTLLAYPGQDFFIGAWRDLKNQRFGMDIPIVLGLSAAFLGSLHSMLVGYGEVYLDSIAMFVFFVLLARYFETTGKIRAASHMDFLAKAVPAFAHRQADNAGEWEEVPVFDLSVGDLVRILPGESVPVDGVIMDGNSSFDESLLTGESMSVTRQPGEQVVAGAINGDQSVIVQVQHLGYETMLDSIRRMVEKGLEKKPRIALLAERAARGFVAVILFIACLTAGIWLWMDSPMWLSNTIAVLIVTCPCALALATPVALAVSSGRFVELGVLPLKIQALETLAEANVAAFDKTGTLTSGHPVLVQTYAIGDRSEEDYLMIATGISSVSEHPLARALREAPVEPAPVEQVENLTSLGLRATVYGGHWQLGRLSFVHDGPVDESIQRVLDECAAQGQSIAVLANDSDIQAVFAFTDSLRKGATTLMKSLRKLGVDRMSILSGDTMSSVSRVGGELGIADVHAGLMPHEKLEWLLKQQTEGRRVVMFGDGINDAPTLAAADVSVSLSGATDLAHVSSDFLLLREDISSLANAKHLAKRTKRNIQQNMLWAITYNLTTVPLAAMGFVPPWLAAIGMSVSSVLVVLNALRLKSSS
ncbi:MAG: heavy metal translocating P-type ATPase [Gammaproteobacteria bacterium]|nr:MAG: heavy metal translocating P-type ATPase [Gammaproteobacteria bacterium]